MTQEEIEEFIKEKAGRDAGDLLLADGFERAFIGISLDPLKAIYSIDLCIDILTHQGMSTEDAEDYFWTNTIGAYMGEQTPLFIYTLA